MKQLLKTATAVALCTTLAIGAQAQIDMPQPSPSATVTQKIGLTDVTVNYSRPSMKGRKVFGSLVEYGKPWRTGANQATKITFKDELTIGGKKVAAGEYALYTIPNTAEWTVILNKDTKLGGDVDSYKKEEEVTRFTVKPINNCSEAETFTIAFTDVTANSANLALLWEKTIVKVPVVADFDARVMQQIQEKVISGTDVKAGLYYQAARYYFENNKDQKQALTWIDKSVQMEPQFWTLHLQAKMKAAANDKKGAVAAANKSIEMAKKDGNTDYVKMNEELIAKVNGKK